MLICNELYRDVNYDFYYLHIRYEEGELRVQLLILQ